MTFWFGGIIYFVILSEVERSGLYVYLLSRGKT